MSEETGECLGCVLLFFFSPHKAIHFGVFPEALESTTYAHVSPRCVYIGKSASLFDVRTKIVDEVPAYTL
jgi:hypothetical protein